MKKLEIINPILDTVDSTQEVVEGLVSKDSMIEKLSSGEAILLRGSKKVVAAGKGLLVKVNTSIGLNSPRELKKELRKIDALSKLGYGPDIMMDLSTYKMDKPLYKYISKKIGCPVGTLPHYLCFNHRKGIHEDKLLAEIENQAKEGVSFMTLHLTPRKKLHEHARKLRMVPTTARGGGLIVEDMYLNNRNESILSILFDEILEILKRFNVVLSIGTTYRPSNVIDALDEIHKTETRLQHYYIKKARKSGVQVMMEGIGHATLDNVQKYVKMIRKYKTPFMPLGPIPTDAAVGFDHVSNAIGGSFMAYLGGADIINSITREEHTGNVPTLDSIIEGLRAARVATHAVNVARFNSFRKKDDSINEKRANNYTCVVEGGIFTESAKMQFNMGCTRCGSECPLITNYKIDKMEENS